MTLDAEEHLAQSHAIGSAYCALRPPDLRSAATDPSACSAGMKCTRFVQQPRSYHLAAGVALEAGSADEDPAASAFLLVHMGAFVAKLYIAVGTAIGRLRLVFMVEGPTADKQERGGSG